MYWPLLLDQNSDVNILLQKDSDTITVTGILSRVDVD